MKYLLTGGTVITGSSSRKSDILIEDEKIVNIAEHIVGSREEDLQILDVSGRLLFPGFIDGHTHFDLEVAGTVTADDFTTGSRAAIAGGTTCIVDFATQSKGETLKEALEYWHKKADGKSFCDYGFHMAITDWNNVIAKELADMAAAGVTSFKLYMTYNTMVADGEMFEILAALKKIGGIAGVHCENDALIKELIRVQKEQGNFAPSAHSLSRPAQVEAEAINRYLTIAGLVDIPAIIVHLSTKEGCEVIQRAVSKGQTVYTETCPQYLLMNDSKYKLPEFEGARYIISPPLRKKEDNDCLWKALSENTIQTIATDHCSFTLAQKDAGRKDFTKIPGGMPGVETRGTLIYTYGVLEHKITINQMCQLMSENPARLYGMYPRKGCLQAGSDADIVVFNPEGESVISAHTQLCNTDYAPFEGIKLRGEVEAVFLRGAPVVRDKKVLDGFHGEYISREKCGL